MEPGGVNMKVKDEVEFNSGVPPTIYKGIITWIDSRARELGVALIFPKNVRGGCMVIDMDRSQIEVVKEYVPSTFRQDLSRVSEEDLRAEIEEIRESRGSRKRKTIVTKTKPSKVMKQLASLSNDVLDKIINEKHA